MFDEIRKLFEGLFGGGQKEETPKPAVERLNYSEASESDLKDLDNRNSLSHADTQVGRYYNYIPFSFEGEVGTQYGLIQTPSWDKKAITRVFIDDGYEFNNPKDSMDFLRSLSDNFYPSNTTGYKYKEFSQYPDKKTAPLEWMQSMRERYIKNNPGSHYIKQAIDGVNRYKLTGRL